MVSSNPHAKRERTLACTRESTFACAKGRNKHLHGDSHYYVMTLFSDRQQTCRLGLTEHAQETLSLSCAYTDQPHTLLCLHADLQSLGESMD